MSLALLSINDIIDQALLNYFLEEVTHLKCLILDRQGKVIFESAGFNYDEPFSLEQLQELTNTPLPIDIKTVKASGIFAKQDCVGYALVETKNQEDSEKQAEKYAIDADFVFQLLNYAATLKSENEETVFNVAYLRNLISLMTNLSKEIGSVFDASLASQIFITECEKIFGAQTGYVYLVKGKQLMPVASFGKASADLKTIEQCFKENKILVGENPARLAVPLQGNNELIGVAYLKDKEEGLFSIEDQKMAQVLSAVLGNAIANISLHENLIKNEKIRDNLGRYLSPNLVNQIIESGGVDTMRSKRMKVAILFSDIRGFTKISEKYTPEQMVAQLNEYFEEMSQIIFKFNGTLDKYVGDMVMVLFGAPTPMEDSCQRAMRTAIEMQKKIIELNQQWTQQGKIPFLVGIGINIGDVVFGNIGSSKAMGLTVIGDHVNIAQRLQAYAKGGEILISEAVFKVVQGQEFKCASLGPIEVKGKHIQAYKVE